MDETLEREFEARLAESSTLAFRVAYSVLRHREDAEDVTQEAFLKAFGRFRQLRDRESLPRLAGAHDLAAGDQPPARGSSPRTS